MLVANCDVHSKAPDWQPYVITDVLLASGQHPASWNRQHMPWWRRWLNLFNQRIYMANAPWQPFFASRARQDQLFLAACLAGQLPAVIRLKIFMLSYQTRSASL
jgi:hypothetical protein